MYEYDTFNIKKLLKNDVESERGDGTIFTTAPKFGEVTVEGFI